jgi:hypothetical protein
MADRDALFCVLSENALGNRRRACGDYSGRAKLPVRRAAGRNTTALVEAAVLSSQLLRSSERPLQVISKSSSRNF